MLGYFCFTFDKCYQIRRTFIVLTSSMFETVYFCPILDNQFEKNIEITFTPKSSYSWPLSSKLHYWGHANRLQHRRLLSAKISHKFIFVSSLPCFMLFLACVRITSIKCRVSFTGSTTTNLRTVTVVSAKMSHKIIVSSLSFLMFYFKNLIIRALLLSGHASVFNQLLV